MQRVWLGLALAGMVGLPVLAQTLAAQNTYGGGAVASADGAADPYLAADALGLEQSEVRAAETNLSIGVGVMHTQYHENAEPGSGDDENGFSYGGTAGASLLAPGFLVFHNEDFYTALNFDLSAGNLNYGGHYLVSGLPVDATDRAVFLRIEGRFGIGFPLVDGMELIPFVAGGYQSWNRNIDLKGEIGTNEQYTAGLLGGGLKLDIPVTPRIVLTGTAEGLGLFAGNVAFNNVAQSHGLGGSAEERLSVGADYAVSSHFHVFGTADWEHFNYAGNKPTLSTYYPDCDGQGDACEFYEPLSTTTQFGVNGGVAYSF
jgi:hypothetical protein